MAATVNIKELNGASAGTPTTSTSARFCTTDSAAPGTNYPLVKPSSGTNYSYIKTFYLNADTTPTGTINNIKWYTDGTIGWTGVTISVKTSSSYTQATGTEGTTATAMSGGTDASTYTSASPLSVTGTLSNPSTGKISDYVLMQAAVSTSAVAGTVAAETITWRYDET
jgi:hypothetical protein